MWPRCEDVTDRYRAALLGLALGDALGTTLEFRQPGTFNPISDLIGGGPFRLPAGAWTDDTSMALCLAESLLMRGGFDPTDQLERYVRWWRHGHLSSTGECFDIGGTVQAALARFERTRDPASGSKDPSTAGNGSLMRLAPVILAFASSRREAIDMAAASSRTTHAAPEAVDACRYLAALLAGALLGESKDRLLSPHFEPIAGLWRRAPLASRIAEVASGSFRRKEPPAIRGTGYVVESLEAALWAFDRSSSFREGALLAVNLGDDADTTGAVYGQLAGAYYGVRGLPAEWLSRLVGRDLIERLADGLFRLAWNHVHPSADLPALDASLEGSYRATVLHYVDERGIHHVTTPCDSAPASPPGWDLPATFYVITASNPMSEKRSPTENTVADRRLQHALLDRGASVRRMDGGSPHGSWYERGFAAWNIPAGSVAQVAQDFGQNGFFLIDEGRRYLGVGAQRPERTEGQPMQVKRIVTVEDAIILAADLHRGQRDKAGEPYILHPLRVALRVRTDGERLAALLHDVVEDCGVMPDDLRERGLDEAVVAAIETLTKRKGEGYMAFIERVVQNPIARAVKLADLADNLDPDRLAALATEDQQRLRAKYEPARERLLAASKA